jgi:hypothetical protein
MNDIKPPSNNLTRSGFFAGASAGEPIPPPNSGDLLREQIAIAKRTPLKILDLEADSEFTSLISHVKRPRELNAEFIVRTGLSKVQALGMTKDEVLAFCDQADRNNADSDLNASNWRPKVVPKHFVLD